MECLEIEELIGPYLDGETGPDRSLDIERHLRTCPACSALYESNRTLKSAIARGNLYFYAPKSMRNSVRSAVKREGKGEGLLAILRGGWPYIWLPLASGLLVFLCTLPFLTRPSPGDLLLSEIVSAHVRSLMPGHLTDVPSSDQHTVKPWFDGRLDFAPAVADPSAQGFPLVGGRLDYIGNRTVAALVYQRRKHIINVFVWPTGGRTKVAGRYERNGYNLVGWTKSGMTHWAVSDVSLQDLEEFARLASK